MRTIIQITLLTSVAGTLMLLTGCSSSPHSPAEKYILVAASTKVPYWQTALDGLQHAASEMGVKGLIDGADGHDPQAEHEAFRGVLAQKPSGILVSVADAALLTPDINAAIEQGIPVITIDSDAPDSKRLLFIGTNNYQAGLLGGNLVAKALDGKGNVIIFKLPNQPNQNSRLAGSQAALSSHSAIRLSQVIDLQDQPDRSAFAYDTIKRQLDSKTKVDAVICLESRSCGGVADAVSRANMTGKITIVAMDTDPEILTWLQKGVVTATIAQKPFTMAYYGAKLLDDLYHHPPTPLTKNWAESLTSPLPTFVDTGSFIVDKENVAAFLQKNKSATSGQ